MNVPILCKFIILEFLERSALFQPNLAMPFTPQATRSGSSTRNLPHQPAQAYSSLLMDNCSSVRNSKTSAGKGLVLLSASMWHVTTHESLLPYSSPCLADTNYHILYRKLPRFTTKLPICTTKFPNTQFRAGMYYLRSSPK